MTQKELFSKSVKALVELYRAGKIDADDKFEFDGCQYTMRELELIYDRESESDNHA